MQSSAASTLYQSEQRITYPKALMLVMSLFFIFGLITCLNDVLIPHLKSLFTLNYTQTMLVQFTFFFAYGVVSIPAGRLMIAMGHQKSLVLGLIVAGIGTLCFYPAAELRIYELFLLALFCLAAGITIIQVSCNPLAVLLGPEATASSRLTLAQAFNSLGTTIAPIIGSMFFLHTVTKTPQELSALNPGELLQYQQTQAQNVQTPYLILAGALFLLALFTAKSSLPYLVAPAVSALKKNTRKIWQETRLMMGVIGIFMYVGAEVSIGSFLVNYLAHTEVGNLPLDQAAHYVAFYWGSAMVGRFLGSYLQTFIKPASLLALHAGGAILLVAVSMTTNHSIAFWSILLVGFCNSIMFPTIFTLAVEGLGDLASKGSGLLCTAIIGGAIMPLLQGVLADHYGIKLGFIIPILCYFYIAYFGFWARKSSV